MSDPSQPDQAADGPAPDDAAFEDAAPAVRLGGFSVTLDGFEGPLDLMLALARQQKLDIRQISIQALADQYLAFIAEARRIRLEIAADYLVMAAWLAYLKSRLLLPQMDGEDEPTGEELAARLQHQLRRLEAMREAAETLLARNRLGRDVFPRGMPEGVQVIRNSVFDCSLHDLLVAYGAQIGRTNVTTFTLRPLSIMSIEEAIQRLNRVLGALPDWASLETFLPPELRGGVEGRSAMASTFSASLELAKQGRLLLRQGQSFGPIYLKGASGS